MKLFISQPMRGKTPEQIKKERDLITSLFSDVEIINSYFENNKYEDPLVCLGESIKLLAEADIVYFCNDWDQYNGCYIEHECAKRYGKKIIYQDMLMH